ncbi:unnamed protein product, partial [Musa acuminata subsp. burmannicoides]
LAGDLGSEPPHDMERRLDELDGELHQDGHAQAAGADARQQNQESPRLAVTTDLKNYIHLKGEERSRDVDIPDDPDGGADDGDEEGEKGEGEAQQPAQRPALAVALAAHPSTSSIPFFLTMRDNGFVGGSAMLSSDGTLSIATSPRLRSSDKLEPPRNTSMRPVFPYLRNEPLMEATESRPARQRIASRCLVQEDAEGAPSPNIKVGWGSLPVNFIKFVLKREDLVSTASMKSGSGTRVKEMNTTTIYSQQPLKQQTNMDFVYKVENLLDLKPVDQLALRKSDEASSYLETPWSGCNKPEGWWRIADKDDLALLVAQKSLQHIENCDLPEPTQTVHYMKDLFSSIENLDASEIFQSSFGIYNANEYSHDSCSSREF